MLFYQMPRKQKKYHFIYRTICVVNNKYYIGMHSTNNLEDGYLGSGKKLWRSLNKYGKNNHEIEILEFLDNRIDLKNREKEIINESMLQDPMCMNLALGGAGGFSIECCKAGGKAAGKKTIDDLRQKFLDKLKNDLVFRDKYCKTMSLATKGENNHFYGKTHTVEAKNKIGKANSAHQQGEKNSQFGTCWIYNEELQECKKIKKEELDDYLKSNWKKGRKMKF